LTDRLLPRCPDDYTRQAALPTSAEVDAMVAQHGYRRTNPGREPAHYILDETLLVSDRNVCLCCQGDPCAC